MKQLNRWALKRHVHKNGMEKWQKHRTCCGRGKKEEKTQRKHRAARVFLAKPAFREI